MAKKKVLSLALALLMIFCFVPAGAITAFADETSGDFTYTVSDNKVTITGYKGSGGAVTIPSKINGKTVTTIGWGAFSNKTNMTGVTIPSTVTLLDSNAFSGTGLKSVTIPAKAGMGQGVFAHCDNLESVTIISGGTSIPESTFAGCTSLKNVTIPSTVTYIAGGKIGGAFSNCTSLKAVHYLGTTSAWNNMNYKDDDWACGQNIAVHCITASSSVTKATLNANGTIHYTCGESGCSGWSYEKTISRPATFTLSATSYTYNGSYRKPTVTVKNAAGSVIASSHYTVSYKNNLNAGTATVTVNFSKSNLYTGSKTLSFTIKPKAITPKVTLSKTSYTYTGQKLAPTVYVYDGDTLLKVSDYTVTWPNMINAGTKTVKITMKGNYSGTKSVTYKINPKAITPTMTLSATAFTYNGKAQKPAVTVKNSNTVLAASDYTVTWPNTINAGTKTVKVTLKGNYSGTCSATYKISPKAITPSVTLSTTAYTYNGSVKTPGVTVKTGATTLKKDTDYTVTYAAGRKNVGTYKVDVKMKGNYSGSKAVSFKINPKGTTLSSITPGASKLSFNVNKQATQTSGYQIQCSTTSGFTSGNYLFTLNGTNTLSKTTSSTLGAKKKYYVRVRTFKTINETKYYSTWSAVKTVTTL